VITVSAVEARSLPPLPTPWVQVDIQSGGGTPAAADTGKQQQALPDCRHLTASVVNIGCNSRQVHSESSVRPSSSRLDKQFNDEQSSSLEKAMNRSCAGRAADSRTSIWIIVTANAATSS